MHVLMEAKSDLNSNNLLKNDFSSKMMYRV